MKHFIHRADGVIDRNQTDWYKDAVIYQLHVKAFQDSDGDGAGDFAGLMQRLDHVQALGATAIWLLPFYPSPLRDDGYDIADFKSVNPSYGKMADFKAFIAEAHRRGLRVITELVINHTSDQHPWFQRARPRQAGFGRARLLRLERHGHEVPGNAHHLPRHREVELDLDPVAAPSTGTASIRTSRTSTSTIRASAGSAEGHAFLAGDGRDGLRLDAIPYLVEREGTNNENLPETHVILKKIRAELDAHYSDRMLLAEANQWPEDTRPYFGDGDECQMGFHFP